MSSAFEKMDKMYRHQRYFYDFTRKYYLLGRDKLISEIAVKPGDNVLEIGSGTGRNLAILAGKYPQSSFFGLDASSAMLETARNNSTRKQLTNIQYRKALADDFSFEDTFGLEYPFDAIYFSYSISMIPTWQESIAAALDNLKIASPIYFVDFYDQRDLPGWFKRILRIWLRQFHVKYPKDLAPYLKSLEEERFGKLTFNSIFRSYSFIARFEKSAETNFRKVF